MIRERANRDTTAGPYQGARALAERHPRETALTLALVALMAVMAAANPAFLAPTNLRDILVNAAPLAIAAAGMTALIVAGQIDISIGSIFAVCAVVAGSAAKAGWPAVAVAVAALAAGAALGAMNGALVAWAGVPAIIATLGTMGIMRGAVTWATRGVWIRGLPDWFREIGEAAPFGIPLALWAMAGVGLAAGVLLARTRPGRRLYAVGSSAHASKLAGIRVTRVTFFAFVMLGTLVGLAALVYATRFTVIQSNAGKGFELQVIAAVVVGGTDIFGGRGTVAGTYLGVVLLAAIGTALTFLHVPAEWEPAIQGILILVAVMGKGVKRDA